MSFGEIVFVTGGARSGKSSWAMEYASNVPGKKLFIATAEARDEEMVRRIKKHREDRGSDWDVAEETIKIASVVSDKCSEYDVILIDCLTLWVSNLMASKLEVEKCFDELTRSLEGVKDKSLIILVSNEVGMGIVPLNKLARDFRDMAGTLNQKVAKTADKAVLVVSGLPLYLKR